MVASSCKCNRNIEPVARDRKAPPSLDCLIAPPPNAKMGDRFGRPAEKSAGRPCLFGLVCLGWSFWVWGDGMALVPRLALVVRML